VCRLGGWWGFFYSSFLFAKKPKHRPKEKNSREFLAM
jgi:hypothetical protein